MTTKRTTSDLARLKYVRSISQLCQFLGMSLREVAEHVPSQRGNRQHIDKSTLAGFGKRRPDGQIRRPGEKQLVALGRLVAQKLTRRYGCEIGVWCTMSSPLVIKAGKECPICGRAFEIKRHTDKCKKCHR